MVEMKQGPLVVAQREQHGGQFQARGGQVGTPRENRLISLDRRFQMALAGFELRHQQVRLDRPRIVGEQTGQNIPCGVEIAGLHGDPGEVEGRHGAPLLRRRLKRGKQRQCSE